MTATDALVPLMSLRVLPQTATPANSCVCARRQTTNTAAGIQAYTAADIARAITRSSSRCRAREGCPRARACRRRARWWLWRGLRATETCRAGGISRAAATQIQPETPTPRHIRASYFLRLTCTSMRILPPSPPRTHTNMHKSSWRDLRLEHAAARRRSSLIPTRVLILVFVPVLVLVCVPVLILVCMCVCVYLACVAFVECAREEQDDIVNHVSVGDIVKELGKVACTSQYPQTPSHANTQTPSNATLLNATEPEWGGGARVMEARGRKSNGER